MKKLSYSTSKDLLLPAFIVSVFTHQARAKLPNRALLPFTLGFLRKLHCPTFQTRHKMALLGEYGEGQIPGIAGYSSEEEGQIVEEDEEKEESDTPNGLDETQ